MVLHVVGSFVFRQEFIHRLDGQQQRARHMEEPENTQPATKQAWIECICVVFGYNLDASHGCVSDALTLNSADCSYPL